ncbi:hypothetical protein L207DRAFT_589150 [Hyaloscypha variabilis F]|uniref:TPR-like protein n=1 Tax=Hyaloscypha variabilis (strain UAMH 11265 / GT02V1 / F) TaxID=1149755 RepID=A0A2J6R523_HYAVF|nr:hypothetical protein L207DRAFT_589150 [Hyaloscypha variabilis F]
MSTQTTSRSESREQHDNLLSRLAGLPLALAQAGSYLRTTRMSLTKYLDLYDNSRRQLLESHRPLFGRGEENFRGSIWTTWSMSINLLSDMTQRAGSGNRYRNALKLLRLITYFEPTDIDFSILRRGLIGNEVPQWFKDVFENELSFVAHAEILVERSLLNGTAKYATFSMHRVVYDWLCAFDEKDLDEQLLSLAMCAIAFSTPGRRRRSWKGDEERLILHALAIEDRLLRCKFISGVPMVDLGTLTSTQRENALLLVRDPEWYMELNNTQQPLAAVTYLFSVFGKTQTGLQIIDTALARNGQGNGIKDAQVSVTLLLSKATILIHQQSFEAARSCIQSTSNLARLHNFQLDLYQVELLNAIVTNKEGNPRLAIQMLTRLVQFCKESGLGLYHSSTLSAVIELDQILNVEGGKGNTTFNDVNVRISLLEPYVAGVEGNAFPELAMVADNTSSLEDIYYELFITCEKIDPPQAVEFGENLLQVVTGRYGTNSKKTAEALSDLCFMRHHARKDDPRALQVGLQAAEILGPDDGREYFSICWRLRDIYGIARNWEEAAIWGRRAVESSESEFGTQSEDHAQEARALLKIYEKDETWYS